MVQNIYNRIQTAWKSLPRALRTSLFVAYDFSVCIFLVVDGARLYFDYLKNRSNFWSAVAFTLVFSVVIVFRNCVWLYKSNAQEEYIAKLQEENAKIISLVTQILVTGENRAIGAPQCIKKDAHLPNDLSKMN